MNDDPLATSVLFDVFALGQAVRAYLATALAAGPLRAEDYAIYSAIFEPETITPTALATRLGMPLTTVMDHLARLEAVGHLRRTPDPRDRRATRVVLTAEGLAAHRATNRLFESAYAAFVAELPAGAAPAKAALGEVRQAIDRAARRVGAPAGEQPAPARARLAPTRRSGGRGG